LPTYGHNPINHARECTAQAFGWISGQITLFESGRSLAVRGGLQLQADMSSMPNGSPTAIDLNGRLQEGRAADEHSSSIRIARW